MIQCKSIEESRSALLRNALLLSSPVVVSHIGPSVALVLYYRQLVLVVASRQPKPTDSRHSINGQGAQNYQFPTAPVRYASLVLFRTVYVSLVLFSIDRIKTLSDAQKLQCNYNVITMYRKLQCTVLMEPHEERLNW